MSRWDDLLVVQEHDTTADQLEHRRRTLPERAELDAAMAELTKLDQRTATVDGERHDLARDQARLEDEIASLNDKASEHDKVLYSGTITNPRELQARQDEIAALKRRISQLEDQQLELMERIEPLEVDLAGLAEDRTAIDARAEGFRGRIAEAEVTIDDELDAVRTERDKAAASIDPELLADYERVRSQLGGVAIARLEHGHCGGCHLALSAVELDRIKRLPLDEPVTCEECGRLLAR